MERTKTTEQIGEVYDYVIVGGGTAGCVLANRLSEDQSRTVLLLEAGSDDKDFPEIEVPAKFGELLGKTYDWCYKSEPQIHACKGLLNKQMKSPRGKVLGGSGSINVMVYSRGVPQDYDRWETLGCDGWGYEDVLPYFIKSEDCKIDNLLMGGVHGRGGLMAVEECVFSTMGEKFIDAGIELGYRHTDNNGRHPIGVMRTQVNTDDGRRAHTSEAFLRPVMHRDNLHIATQCHVTKILIDNSIARAVEFTRKSGKETVRARREIVLSAGTIGSAQILMLSGIGPRQHLQSLGIPVVADLPVGSALQDHVMVHGIEFALNGPILPGGDLFSEKNRMRYDKMRSGPIATPLCEGTGFFHSTSKSSENQTPAFQVYFFPVLEAPELKDNAGISNRHWESMFAGRDNQVRPGVTLFPVLSHPKSKGTLRLRSADPHEYPILDPNYLSEPDDVNVLVDGIKTCRRFCDTKPFQDLGARCIEHFLPDYRGTLYSDDYWAEYARTLTQTVHHLCGTCRMGRRDDPTTVTDPQLRVKGIGRLRVIDASVIPEITSGNTNAPTVMIAEKGADMIKGVYKATHH